MSQQQDLDAVSATIKQVADAATFAKLADGLDAWTKTFDPSTDVNIVKSGNTLPYFNLPDATSKQVSSQDLLSQARKGLLIVFYRGSWCPYCNIQVQYLQRNLEELNSRGVTLVAITPEVPDYTLTTVEKNGLKFPVLTDLHNDLARKLGIIFDQSYARELHAKRGIDLRLHNQEDTWEVPIPTTILVGKDGLVRNVHFDADFRKRLDPQTAIGWVDAMAA